MELIKCILSTPANLTVIPQSYTIECYTVGILAKDYLSDWYYRALTFRVNRICPLHGCKIGKNVVDYRNRTSRNYFRVAWQGKVVQNGFFSSFNDNGDHVIIFRARSGQDQTETGTIVVKGMLTRRFLKFFII